MYHAVPRLSAGGPWSSPVVFFSFLIKVPALPLGSRDLGLGL